MHSDTDYILPVLLIYGLFNDIVSISAYLISNGRVIQALIRGIVPEFDWRVWGKPQVSVRMTGVPAKITEDIDFMHFLVPIPKFPV